MFGNSRVASLRRAQVGSTFCRLSNRRSTQASMQKVVEPLQREDQAWLTGSIVISDPPHAYKRCYPTNNPKLWVGETFSESQPDQGHQHPRHKVNEHKGLCQPEQVAPRNSTHVLFVNAPPIGTRRLGPNAERRGHSPKHRPLLMVVCKLSGLVTRIRCLQ